MPVYTVREDLLQVRGRCRRGGGAGKRARPVLRLPLPSLLPFVLCTQ